MSLGTPFVPDLVPVVNAGVISNLSAGQMVTRFGAGSLRTPTRNFSLELNGHTVSFLRGVPVVVDAHMLAAFTAHNAPVN